jgi:predicted O-methyltransferase YrrM
VIERLKSLLGLRRGAAEVNPQAAEEPPALESIPKLECDVTFLRYAEGLPLDEIFNSPELAAAWEGVAPIVEALDIPDATGAVNPGDRRAIFYLTSYLKPRFVLEVGTHLGASTVHIAAALDRCNSRDRESRSLTSVDVKDVNDQNVKPWLEYGGKASPAEMVDAQGWARLVNFVTSASLPYMAGCAQKYDLIFLDGDHGAATVYQEVPAALRLLREGGVILLHDYFPDLKPLWSNGVVIPGPATATERFRREGAPIRVLPLGQLPWPTKLGSNVTSLAVLTRARS